MHTVTQNHLTTPAIFPHPEISKLMFKLYLETIFMNLYNMKLILTDFAKNCVNFCTHFLVVTTYMN